MPYQTVMSPCSLCKHGECARCNNNVYTSNKFNVDNISPKQDKDIENLWRECEDITFVEDKDGNLVLGQPWRGFPVGVFTQDDWFYWVDDYHSKGAGWVYENISPYDLSRK